MKSWPRARWKVLAAVILGAGLIGAAGFGILLFSCMHEHSRPHGHQNVSFDIHPDGGRVIFCAKGTGGSDLFELNLESGKVTQRTNTGAYERMPRWSPDGNSIVYSAGLPWDRADHVFLMDVATGKSVQLTSGDRNDTWPSFSPDGSTIIFARETEYRWGGLASNWYESGVLFRIRRDGSGEELLVRSSRASHASITPDGNQIVYEELGQIQVAQVNQRDRSKPVNSFRGSDPAVSPDGKSLAFVKGTYSPDFRLYIRSIAKGESKLVAKAPSATFSPRFGPDGKLYFLVESWPSGGFGTPVSDLWMVDLDRETAECIAESRLFDAPMQYKSP